MHFTCSLFAAGIAISAMRTAPANIAFHSNGANPAVAFNGNRFLTIWQIAGHVYGELADPARGTKSDAFPVLIDAHYTYPLQLIAAGGGYLAAWNEDEQPYVAMLTSEGAVEQRIRLDSPKFHSTANFFQRAPDHRGRPNGDLCLAAVSYCFCIRPERRNLAALFDGALAVRYVL